MTFMALNKGLIQVCTGEGKGKTTAALGLAMRAAGQGLKVYIVQFMKGWPYYGELKTVGQHPNITLRQFGRPDFVDKENPDPVDVRMAQEALDHAREIVVRGEHELVILDEVNVALAWKLIDLQDLLSLLGEKPEEVELVLTGRHAHPEVIAHADLVTEMREIKHPYQKGVTSRRGIDY
jgi:cob(I)alamin adenosyltransferase